VFELSTAVVDIKVTDMVYNVCDIHINTAGLNACGDKAMPPNYDGLDGMIKLGNVHHQTELNLSFFPKVT